MCLGFTGSPSLKSKADALKYAIEFTATGEYPNRTPDIKKAKELYNFICENVQLPDVETDQLSNSLNGFTSLMEKLSKEKDEKVNEESEPAGEVVGEPDKEEAIPLPDPNFLGPVANLVKSVLKNSNFKAISRDADGDRIKEIFLLERSGEALRVTIVHDINPLK